MKADDSPEKHRMKGPTEVKHRLLEKYLKPWLFKISELNSRILYIDGFAGWGYYPDGSPGSPLIAMDVFAENYDVLESKVDNYFCYFIEKDPENFSQLKQAVDVKEKNCPPEVQAVVEKKEFEEFAREFLSDVDRPIPTFVFIDPFGYSGLPFDVVSNLINSRESGVELFITFMSGKMAQFMEGDTHGVAISEILGTEDWREHVDTTASKNERAKQLLDVYKNQLRNEAGVEYVWPFRMSEESKTQTAYYLIHATNKFDGHDIMKKIMYKEGAGDQFAYLGPEHYPFDESQVPLAEYGVVNETDSRIEEFADRLYEVYKGETTTLKEVIKDTTRDTPYVETHYRQACKHLQQVDLLEVTHRPDRPDGNKERGIGLDDDIEFLNKGRLDDFL